MHIVVRRGPTIAFVGPRLIMHTVTGRASYTGYWFIMSFYKRHGLIVFVFNNV